jgi:hypothetical protein
MSNFYCHHGKAGGSPNRIEKRGTPNPNPPLRLLGETTDPIRAKSERLAPPQGFADYFPEARTTEI